MRLAIRNLGLILPAVISLFWINADAAAQPRHQILATGNRFFLVQRESRRTVPFDMWSTRLANAVFDGRFTDRVIANLDDYLRYGVNTLSVGIQGGNLGSNTFNQRYPRVYNTDGSLKLECKVWNNLKRLLAETDRRGMVLIIQYWYFKRDQNVPTESAALEVTRRVTRWLKDTGHRNYLLDLVNEFGHTEYGSRSLFSTVGGALRLLNAVYEVDGEVLAGMSPPGRLFSPEGYVSTGSGKKWVQATVTYSHNQPADPRNSSSYYLHGLPRDPLGKPYVNNEFNKQLGYEKYPKKDPRTGNTTYGHWDRATVERYVADLIEVRRLGGYANVFSHLQQYLTRDSDLPVAEIGPAGTQPESTAGGGEPSMHWCFDAIARLTGREPLARRADFNAGHTAGFETALEGQWQMTGGELCQTDGNCPLAWTRIATAGGDLAISLEAGFSAAPGATSRLGVQVGAASPDGPAYRLLIGPDDVRLDQLGGQLAVTTVKVTKRERDQYGLTFRDGRVLVTVNGRTLIAVDDVTPVTRTNLLLLTRDATAVFDNLRVGPLAEVTFDNGKTGAWTADPPNAWEIVAKPGTNNDLMWQVTAGSSEARHAALDRTLADFEFSFLADLGTAVFTALRFRAAGITSAFGDGYLLRIMKDGTIALDRMKGSAAPKELAYRWASIQPSNVSVRVAVDGARIRVFIDGRPVIDVIDGNTPLAPGGLALVAYGGTARFDRLQLETGPRLFPSITVHAPGTEPLEAGFSLTASDPDGALDLGDVRLYIDKGDAFGFQDVTFLLDPRHRVFSLARNGDGKGATARLLRSIPLEGRRWTLRFVARDHDDKTSMIDRRLYTVTPR